LSSEVPQWQGCNPVLVVQQLKKLTVADIGRNTKIYFTSYPLWDRQTPQQKASTLAFWEKLPENIKAAIITKSKADTASASAENELRRKQTSKDDLVRLLHLRKLPAAQMDWYRVENPASRRELDGRRSDAPSLSGQTMAEDFDSWGTLASKFMNYEEFNFQNVLIQYSESATGKASPIKPFVPRIAEVAVLATSAHDVNPSNMERSTIIRDGAWVKEWWTKLKGYLSQVFVRFNRSGEMTGTHEAEIDWVSDLKVHSRWIYHSNEVGTFPAVIIYAFGIMDKSDFESLGRIIESAVGRDESIAGTHSAGTVDSANLQTNKDEIENVREE
jgi:hypothetical protein